jgi:hypothetical protein
MFLTAMSWGQAAKPAAPPAPPKAARATAAAPNAVTGTITPNTAVITIPGLCDKPAAAPAKAAECKTVVSRAEFEQLVNAVAPTIAPAARKQLATQYGMALVMVHKAHEMGLDKGPKFEELLRVARIGVITKELNQQLQDDASKIQDKDIEAYYHTNEGAFQQADLERVFIPRSKQVVEAKDKPVDDAAKKSQQESEEAMKKLADSLRTRAAAGEDFEKLQEEAAAAADFKGKPPTKLGKVRRTSLPPDQAQIFSLKPGEASQLITTPNGYLIYKIGEKDTLPMDKVREEIFSTLRSQRMQETLQKIQASSTPQLNDQYFSAPATGPASEPGNPAVKAPESGPK